MNRLFLQKFQGRTSVLGCRWWGGVSRFLARQFLRLRGKAGEMLAAFGIPVEWEFIQSRILGDAELDGLKARLLNGEIPFTPVLQNKLCVALGVDGYNAFVREYNGK